MGWSSVNQKCRILSHLGYEGKNGRRDSGISLCPRLTSDVKSLFLRCDGMFPSKSIIENVDGRDALMVLGNTSNGRESPCSTQEDSCTAPEQVALSASRVIPSAQTSSDQRPTPSSVTRPQKQSRLADGFEEAERRKLNMLWANVFYSANIPFAVARTAAFKKAVMRTADFKRPYSPPSYQALRTKLLDEAKADLEVKQYFERFRASHNNIFHLGPKK